MGESIQAACYFMQSTQLNFTLSIRDAYQNEQHRLKKQKPTSKFWFVQR